MLVLVLLITLFPAFTFAQTMNVRTLAGDGTPITDTTAGRLDVTVQSPVNAAQSGTWNVNNIAGTISLPTGAATESTLGTLLLNSTFTGRLPAAFASADNIAAQTATFVHGGLMAWDSGGGNWDRLLLTSGALHVNVQNATLAVTQSGTWNINSITTLPALATGANTIGAVNLAQYTPVTGRLPVDGSGVTQPVSGSVTVTQGTGTNLHVVCDSGCSSSAGFADNSAFTFGTTAVNPIAGVLDDTATNTATENSAAVARITAQKGLHVNIRNNSGTELGVSGAPLRVDPTGTTTQPISAASLPLPTGAATLAEQQTQTTALQLIDNLPLAQGATTSGQNGVLVQGAVTTAAPTYTTGNTNPISLQTDGSQRVAVTNTPAVTQSGTWTVQPGNTQNTTAWLTQPQGNVAHDAVDSGNPTKIGCHARTTNRTAVADADRADVVCDDNGQLVVTPMAPRDRVVRSGVVTVSTTTETTLLAAGGAGVFRDLTYLKCTNNSATLVRVDLRDATAGTVIDSWALAASGGGFNLAFSVPYAQASANNNWTIQLSGAVTDVRCSCQAVEKN